MSTKAEWAELFESVHGRKPSPQEFLDAKAADFDTSTLIAQVASVQEAANEPVAEEVPAEQASSESPFGDAAFSEVPAQQPTPQFDSSMFEKASIPTAKGFGTVPNPVDSSADKLLFNLILPIVTITLAVIFAILAWIVSPAWLFIILTVLVAAVAVVSLLFSLKSSKKLLSIIAQQVLLVLCSLCLSVVLFFKCLKTLVIVQAQARHQKLLIKMMTAIQNLTQKVTALTSTIILTKMLNLTGMNLSSKS